MFQRFVYAAHTYNYNRRDYVVLEEVQDGCVEGQRKRLTERKVRSCYLKTYFHLCNPWRRLHVCFVSHPAPTRNHLSKLPPHQ